MDSSTVLRMDALMAEVFSELLSAVKKHKPLNSLHEAYSVLLEEMDELWDEVKKKREVRDLSKVREEAIQVAAMAMRTIVDCIDSEAANTKHCADLPRS